MITGRCLVTGAGGALGPAVVRELQREWGAVRVVSRRPAQMGPLLPDTEIVAGDVTRPHEIDRAARDCDVVVHLAAHLHISHPSVEDLARYESVNVAGTRAVVDAARARDVRRVVFASTIAVYGYGRAGALDETSTPLPQTPYGSSKYRGESIVLDARTGDGAPMGSVLRLAAVYGPRVKGNYRRLLEALASGRFVPIGSGANRRTLVHEHDVAHAVRLASTHPAAAGRVFNITDGHCHTLSEIIDSICKALDRRPPRWSLPVGIARAAVAGASLGVRALGKSWYGDETLAKYLEDVCVGGDRARVELGFNPIFDLDRGWRQTIQELRSTREIGR